MSQESRYSKVFVKIWHSKDFRAISEDGKMLFMYLLSSPHRNMGGFYYLPLPYLCYDVGLDEKRITKALQELADRDMALYDFDAQVVLIKKWFCYNPIENENQAKGLNKQLAEIPKSKLFESFVNCVKEHCKYTETILKGFDIPFSNPSETLSKPYTKPGTGTGTVSGAGDNSPNPPGPDTTPDQPDEKTKEPEKPKKPRQIPLFDKNTEQYKLAMFMRQCILSNLPKAKVPKPTPEGFRRWAYDIDLMMRIDNRRPDEIRELMDWVHKDQFWKANILSPGKLRDKWDTLIAHKKRDIERVRGAPSADVRRTNINNFTQRPYDETFYKKFFDNRRV